MIERGTDWSICRFLIVRARGLVLDTENEARAENYRAQAALMRDTAELMSDTRLRSECLELAYKWDALAKRLEDLMR